MLPHGTADRLLAAGTLLAALAFVGVVAANWETIRGGDERAEVSLAAATPAEAPAAPAPAARPASRPRATAPAQPSAPAAERPEELTVSAVGGDSWLEVRLADAAGEQLFFGTLAEGEEQTFSPLPVWVRIGAVGNLELRLGEEPLRSLPPAQGGVVELTVSPDGAAPAG